MTCPSVLGDNTHVQGGTDVKQVLRCLFLGLACTFEPVKAAAQ